MISYLTGRAEAWATVEWARNSPVYSSLQLFSDTLRKIFDRTPSGREAARSLMGLFQGKRRVWDYAIQFHTLTTDSGWKSSSLFDAFLHGLAEPIKDQLISLKLPSDLDSLISLSIRIDNRLQERGERGPGQVQPRREACRQVITLLHGILLLGSSWSDNVVCERADAFTALNWATLSQSAQ